MAHAGQEIVGQGGFRLRLVKTAAETGGEVLEGTIRAIIDGDERRYGTGEQFDVPARTPHQMTADEPARVRWEIRPALRTAEFFERLYGDGPDSAQAAPSISEFFAEFSDEIRLTGTT